VVIIKQLEKTDMFDADHAYIFRMQNAEAPIVKLTCTVPWAYT